MCGGMRDVWRCESIWSRGLGACTLGICSLLHVEVLSEELMNGVYSMIQRSFSHAHLK